MGFIATAFVFVRLTIIAINYVKVNFPKEEQAEENKTNTSDQKGF